MKMLNRTKLVSDYVYESINEKGNAITIDMRQEKKEGQSPMELVLSAISGCAAVDIVLMLKKKRKTIVSLEIETEGERRDEHPRSFTRIHSKYILTSPDTREEEFYKVSKLALEKYCSVASSLKVAPTFSIEIKVPEQMGP